MQEKIARLFELLASELKEINDNEAVAKFLTMTNKHTSKKARVETLSEAERASPTFLLGLIVESIDALREVEDLGKTVKAHTSYVCRKYAPDLKAAIAALDVPAGMHVRIAQDVSEDGLSVTGMVKVSVESGTTAASRTTKTPAEFIEACEWLKPLLP